MCIRDSLQAIAYEVYVKNVTFGLLHQWLGDMGMTVSAVSYTHLQMSRSQKGLAGAGEWETLKKMLPDFKGKRVLDLG